MYIVVTYIRSAIGRHHRQKATIKALGFSKLNQSRLFEDSPSVRGMITKVNHLVAVQEIENDTIEAIEANQE